MADPMAQAQPLAGLRLAIVDLLFSWPPNGGADVDLFHVMEGLVQAGAELRLFVLHVSGSWERGRLSRPETLPCSVHRFEYARGDLKINTFSADLAQQLRAWSPDVVFMAHGFSLKPLLAEHLTKHWPILIRCYAHEMACLRDARRFRDGNPCPLNNLRNFDTCRQCAMEHLSLAIRSGQWNAWIEEFVAAGAWREEWSETAARGIRQAAGLIVSNTELAREAREFNPEVYVVPGGTRVQDIRWEPEPPEDAQNPPMVFLPGRCEDPVKGLAVFRRAATLLTERGVQADFCCTHPDPLWTEPPVRSLGWLTPEETIRAYSASRIVVVPSVWHEPFGLVAVEAMAASRPVVASRTGGLADIIVDGETGLLVPPNDPAALADAIARLLAEPDTRARMGAAGRLRAELYYDWEAIINRHYVPLLLGFRAR